MIDDVACVHCPAYLAEDVDEPRCCWCGEISSVSEVDRLVCR